MARIVYLCDWLPPDFGAVGQYALNAARALAGQGHQVVLVGLTSGPTASRAETVGRGGLTIRTLSAPAVDRARLGRRLAWTLATNLRLLRHAWADLRRCDRVVFTGSPPFLLHLLVPVGWWLRVPLTYRITDFHPECLMAALDRVPWPLRLFHRLTVALRRRVDRFEVLGRDQQRRLAEIGIPDARITLDRDTAPVPIDPAATPLPVPAALAGRVVLLYSGNWGVAHEVDTLVEGYLAHHRQGSGRVGLWINAIGANADRVEQRLRAAGAPVARSRPVPLADLPRLLVTPAAHLICLRDGFVGYVLPSKVYGCLLSGRPILFIGSDRSDVDLLCRERCAPGQTYLRVPVGDVAGVADALETLADGYR